jgi:hypothetical protein
MYEANVNCKVLKEYLGFLIQKGLVEERTFGKERVVYANIPRGVTVLNYFRELAQVFPMVDEARNRMPFLFNFPSGPARRSYDSLLLFWDRTFFGVNSRRTSH